MRKLLPALLLAAALTSAAWAAGVIAFTGPSAWPESAGWVAHPVDTENYMETWQMIGQAENGGYLFVSFVVSNAGLGDYNPGIGVSYHAPDGRVTSNDIKLDRKVLKASQQTLDVAIADMHLWRQGNAIRCVVPRGKVLVDATLTPTVTAWRQGSGRIVLGSPADSWNWAMNVPRGRLTGKVTIGGQSFDLAGAGYLDHSWSNQAYFDFSKHWITLRYYGPKGSVNLFQLQPADHLGAMPINHLAVMEDGQPVRSSSAAQIELGGWRRATDYRVPTVIRGRARIGQADFVFEGSNGRLRETSDPLRSLSEIERQVIRLLVAKPMTFRVVMDTKLTRTENGQTTTEHGRGVATMLYFAQ